MNSHTNSHSFDSQLACIVGVEKAILIGYFQFWIGENEKRKSADHFHKGEYWTYSTAIDLTKKYPYLKGPSIYRWLGQLEKDGWIKTGKFNAKQTDQTTWYGRGAKMLQWIVNPNYQNDNSIPQTDNSNYQNDSSNYQNDKPNYQNDKCNIKVTVINTVNSSVSNCSVLIAFRDDSGSRKFIQSVLNRKRKKRPPTPLRDPLPPNIPFGDWYDLYDKKRDPKECETEWLKLTDELRLSAYAHTSSYVAATPKQFRKDPIRYLKKQSWNDEIIDRDASTTYPSRHSVNGSKPASSAEFGARLDAIINQRYGAGPGGEVTDGGYAVVVDDSGGGFV